MASRKYGFVDDQGNIISWYSYGDKIISEDHGQHNGDLKILAEDGALPFILDPPGENEIYDYDLKNAVVVGGHITYGVIQKPNEQITADAEKAENDEVISFQNGVQTHLDNVAKSWGYDSIISLCSYHGCSHLVYSAEAAAGMEWRSAVWQYCYDELEKIKAGKREKPESIEGFILELPKIVRPE